MLAIGLALAAALPRLLGGLTALRNRDSLHVVLGFAGGALIGVAVFETIPEARDATGSSELAYGAVAAGVVLFALLERRIFGHVHTEDQACNPTAGHIGAAGITTHAFLDGLAIGAAFGVSSSAGVLVSAAILIHAFADGLNTVSVVLRHGHGSPVAWRWLIADAAAPVAGAALGLTLDLPAEVVGTMLAFFGGMFLYLGAGSLLPEAHRTGRDRGIIFVAGAAGLALAFAATQLAS